jgi:hypothetical protein
MEGLLVVPIQVIETIGTPNDHQEGKPKERGPDKTVPGKTTDFLGHFHSSGDY